MRSATRSRRRGIRGDSPDCADPSSTDSAWTGRGPSSGGPISRPCSVATAHQRRASSQQRGEELFATNAHDIPTLPVWHHGGMVVLGDAAHAASPASGQGASMALEDAVVLAKALRDIPDQPRALATFEQLRRPRVEANVAASAALDSDRRPPSPGAAPSAESFAATAQLLDWGSPLSHCR